MPYRIESGTEIQSFSEKQSLMKETAPGQRDFPDDEYQGSILDFAIFRSVGALGEVMFVLVRHGDYEHIVGGWREAGGAVPRREYEDISPEEAIRRMRG